MVKPQAETTGAMVMSNAPLVVALYSSAVDRRSQTSCPTAEFAVPAFSRETTLSLRVRESWDSRRLISACESSTAFFAPLP